MPTVKWSLGSAFVRLSKTDAAIAGLNSFEDSP
jgi:hypothetical protein